MTPLSTILSSMRVVLPTRCLSSRGGAPLSRRVLDSRTTPNRSSFSRTTSSKSGNSEHDAKKKFNDWRKRNAILLIGAGSVLGAGVMGFGVWYFFLENPHSIEKLIVSKTANAFSKALTFEARKKVYFGLPDVNVRVPTTAQEFQELMREYRSSTAEGNDTRENGEMRGGDASPTTTAASGSYNAAHLVVSGEEEEGEESGVDIATWADVVNRTLDEVESSFAITAKMLMRRQLVNEALQFTDFRAKLAAVKNVLPPCVERDVIVTEELEKKLASEKWLEARLLEDNPPSSVSESCDLRTRIVIAALAFFPGPINKLIHYLTVRDDPDFVARCEMELVDLASAASLSSETSENNVVARLGMYAKELAEEEKRRNRVCTEFDRRRDSNLRGANNNDVGVINASDTKDLEERARRKRASVRLALRQIKAVFDEPEVPKSFVLQKALSTTISSVMAATNERPYFLYVRAIEDDLLGPLRRDARITEDILTQVKLIFLALPPDIQARILLRAITHPLARDISARSSSINSVNNSNTNDAEAEMVRDLLSSGGVVAVKLAQMLAEDPKIPHTYRRLLGKLRDDNEPMSASEFFHAIPPTLRASITHLGRCLGVGSVKQVQRARFASGVTGGIEGGEGPEEERAVAVLRINVENEAMASLAALERSDELGVVAKRLGRLVYGEFNLFQEGEALQEFQSTKIGMHPLFRVVRLYHHSPKCLVEEIAVGPTLASVLENAAVAEKENNILNRKASVIGKSEEKTQEERARSLRGPRYDIARVKQLLTEYHRAVFQAFVEDGMISSDIHLGNAVLDVAPDRSSASSTTPPRPPEMKLILFDVGQWERISSQDTKALLWVLGSISSVDRRISLREVALTSLEGVCTLAEPPTVPPAPPSSSASHSITSSISTILNRGNPSAGPSSSSSSSSISSEVPPLETNAAALEQQRKKHLWAQLNKAYDEAIAPFEDGSLPDQRQAYMLFLRACERHGVNLPKGAFSVAKMIDGMISQKQQFGLHDVAEECMEAFLRKHMSWWEASSVLKGSISTAVGKRF